MIETNDSRTGTAFEMDGTEAAGALAGALFTVEFITLYESLRFTTAARATVFLYAAPFFVALGAASRGRVRRRLSSLSRAQLSYSHILRS